MSSISGATLTAAFQVRGDRLEIRYAIHNGSRGEIYVFDAAIHVGPRGDATVDTATPEAERQADGVVLLLEKLLPLPPGTTFTAPPSPYANRIASGETRSRVVSVSLPLRDRTLPERAAARVVTSARIRFEVGVVFPAPDLYPEEQVIGGVKVWQLAPAAYGLQQVLRIESPISPPISIETTE